MTLSGAECTKLELVFDLHSLYTFPITTFANVIVAILNIQIIMPCVAQAETPLLLCIIITITLIVYTKENHATIAPTPDPLFGPHNVQHVEKLNFVSTLSDLFAAICI